MIRERARSFMDKLPPDKRTIRFRWIRPPHILRSCPHSLQKSFSGELSALHWEQMRKSFVLHLPQNLAVSGFSNRHFGQFIGAIPARVKVRTHYVTLGFESSLFNASRVRVSQWLLGVTFISWYMASAFFRFSIALSICPASAKSSPPKRYPWA